MSTLSKAGLLVVALGASAPATALATYSIVAADRATRQVGGAVTSCVAPSGVGGVYGSAPGVGAVASQAASNRAGRDRAVQLLSMDVAPEQIITNLTSPAFDTGAARRQYGVVDMMGRAAGHSGTGNGVFSNDVQGDFEGFTYSVQGNILTGAGVLDQAVAAFRGDACDLADRLMRALEAGAANNQGDRRCTPAGAPSDSAFLQVDRPGEPAGSYLRLSVVTPRRTSPLPALRAQFDAWRRTHPCPDTSPEPLPAPSDAGPPTPPRDAGGPPPPRPVDSGSPPPPDAASGAGGSGGGSTGQAGASVPPPTPPPAPPLPGTPGTPPTGVPSDPGAPVVPPPVPGTGGTSPPSEAGPPSPPGCDCRTGSGGDQRPAAVPALVFAVALLLTRRRKP